MRASGGKHRLPVPPKQFVCLLSGFVTRFSTVRLNSAIIRERPSHLRNLSHPSDPNRPFCRYCEESTYHEYDPYFHAWVCQTCFGGMIRADKKDPISIIRAELNGLAVHVAKDGYNPIVKEKMRQIAGRLKELAERP